MHWGDGASPPPNGARLHLQLPCCRPLHSLHQAACCSLPFSLRGNACSRPLHPLVSVHGGPPGTSSHTKPMCHGVTVGQLSGLLGQWETFPQACPFPPRRGLWEAGMAGEGATQAALPSVVSGPPLGPAERGEGLQPANSQGTKRFRKAGAQHPRQYGMGDIKDTEVDIGHQVMSPEHH